MSLTSLLTFAAVAMLLTMTPGPNGILIAKTVPTVGRAAGLCDIAGFVAAFYLHGVLSILGVSLILVQSAQAFFVLKMLGAAYLCWIGAKALWAAWKGIAAPAPMQGARRGLWAAFAAGFLTNALNPKVAMFYLAAFPQFMSYDAAGRAVVGSALSLVTIHALTVVIWFGVIVLLFGRLAGAARSPTFQRWLNGVTGAVFVGFGAKLAAMRAAP